VHDRFDNNAGGVDFQELADHLLEQGVQASPSMLQGCLCGMLSAGASHEQEYSLFGLAGAMELSLHGELAELVMRLYTTTADAFQDEAFDFHPLLPEDDADIADRVEALADWCKGFLAGFAHASVGEDRSTPRLSEDSNEILKDFAAIARAGLDDSEDSEEEEGSYMELVEYLRFAALNLYMDNVEGAGDGSSRPAPIH
jgi:uncharacterized protein YgfB (UPF0149 family)